MNLGIGLLASTFVLNPIAALAFTPAAQASADGQFVTTESGNVRCKVSEVDVVCSGSFQNTPIEGRRVYNIVSIDTLGGSLQWSRGNLSSTDENALQNDLVLTYNQTFQINGWTILPTSSGTRFTNDDPDFGMFVSIEKVTAF